MPGKMVSSPYHVETVQYKYAAEQSEVPIGKSTFNQTITRCSHCAWHFEEKKRAMCANISVHKRGGNHCEGYLDCKEVRNLTQFRNNMLMKYNVHENHKLIQSLIKRLRIYKPGNNRLIDYYYGKRWFFAGVDGKYDKSDLSLLVEMLKGESWSGTVAWNYWDCDFAVDLGERNSRIKEINDRIKRGYYVNRQQPKIIAVHRLHTDIVKMLKSLAAD